MILSPSLLSSDLANLKEEVFALEEAEISWLHLDVMDGRFVPNITFGPPLIRSLRSHTSLFFDCHLMIEEPGRYLEDFARAGADLIVVHAEAETHLERTLSKIKEMGLKSGLALNPSTDLSSLTWICHAIDLVLIMGVNPGFSGQKFLPNTISKVAACRTLLDHCNASHVAIEVDGGACPENASALVEAGADILVSGSAFFGHKPYGERKKQFEQACLMQNVSDRAITWSH